MRGELETEQTATPSSNDYSSTSFSFCWAAQPRVTEGRKPSVWSWFSLPRTATRTPSTTDFNKLKPSVAPGYIIVYICGRRNCTEFNPSTGQGDTPISSTGCTGFLIDGWVEGQYVTISTNPSARAGYDTRSIFKRSLTGLNSEFSFS